MEIAKQQKANLTVKDWATQTTAVSNGSQITEHN
jgi:hypothetical protein